MSHNTPPILVLPIGAATEKDIALCRAAGVVVLSVEDPSKVRFVDPPLRDPNVVRACVRIIKEITSGKRMDTDEVRRRLADAVMASTDVSELIAADI